MRPWASSWGLEGEQQGSSEAEVRQGIEGVLVNGILEGRNLFFFADRCLKEFAHELLG